MISSERVAERIAAHPVVLRRALAQLRSAGLVEGRSGPGGGWAIARDPDDIGLGRVRRASKPALEPDGDRLAWVLRTADDAFARELERVSIGDLVRDPT